VKIRQSNTSGRYMEELNFSLLSHLQRMVHGLVEGLKW
jgi:hypothetical protein